MRTKGMTGRKHSAETKAKMSRAAKAQWEQANRDKPLKNGQPKKFLKIDQQEQVRKLAGIGCTHKEISTVMGLNQETLELRYGDIIKDGRNRMNASLRRRQLKKAVDEGNTAMLIWMGKQYLGQHENPSANLMVQGDNISINILPPGQNSPPQTIEGRVIDQDPPETGDNTGGALSHDEGKPEKPHGS